MNRRTVVKRIGSLGLHLCHGLTFVKVLLKTFHSFQSIDVKNFGCRSGVNLTWSQITSFSWYFSKYGSHAFRTLLLYTSIFPVYRTCFLKIPTDYMDLIWYSYSHSPLSVDYKNNYDFVDDLSNWNRPGNRIGTSQLIGIILNINNFASIIVDRFIVPDLWHTLFCSASAATFCVLFVVYLVCFGFDINKW